MGCSPPGSSVHGDSPGKNTGVGCHLLLQGIFPTQDPALKADSLPTKPPGKPQEVYSFLRVLFSFTFVPELIVYDDRLVFPILDLFITGYFKLRYRLHTVKGKLVVAQFSPTLCNPMDCSPPHSSVHGILKARILDWVAIFFSKRSSQPRDRTPGLLHYRQTPYCLSHRDKS